ncbi:DUF6542 domain-containing protein [Nocardioides plantarum]|uniref:DUF6542 domain-containing protein n=1 Tax=Nocardioides plantarum TaxID=29299 RepID=A0ABV5K924_9ACTN|nr:DUF6542 domain-containing protein [Nocardioides plantarum]
MTLPGTRTLWEEGRAPGHEVVALGVALALTAAAVDLLLTSRMSLLFDLGFVALCVALALAVRPADFFHVGVLPPLLMLSTFLLLAMSRAEAIAEAHDGVLQAVVSGLSHHSLALGAAYVLTLGVLAVRQRIAVLREAELGADPGELTRTGPGRRLPA